MEARRQAAQVVTPEVEPLFTVVGHSPGGHAHSSRPPGRVPGSSQPPDRPHPVPGLAEGPAPSSLPKPSTAPIQANYQPLEEDRPPPPALWKSIAIFVGFLVLGAGFLVFWYRHDLFPPDPVEVVAQISEGPNHELVFEGETFQGTFKMDQEEEGSVNQIVRTSFPEMPFVTHELVLVSGDYGLPDMVGISEVKDHQIIVTPKVDKPDGRILLVHAIPADAKALADLMKIQKNQFVVIIGDIVNNGLTDSMGSMTLTSSGTAKIIRVREVMFDQQPQAPAPK